jgi:hypothetical protein
MLAKQGARACLPAPVAAPPPSGQRSLGSTHPASPRPDRSSHADQFFHSPRPRAPQAQECEHGVAYRLDRLTTGPPCLPCITLSPRDASLSPIRLRSPGSHSPYVPFLDFDFE